MSDCHHHGLVARLAHFFHEKFIWLLIGSYLVAACFPAMGRWMRDASFGQLSVLGETTKVSLPTLMLACLLLNAGLGVQITQFKHLLKHKLLLVLGLVANSLVPIIFIFLVNGVMQLWHNPDEVQQILVGLALVASMPIAGSSTAWSQNANGNLALSLSLVLFSTLLSPFITPAALHSVGWIATGDYAEDLHELAATGTQSYLAFWVITPTLLGIALRFLASEKRVDAIKPHLKVVNSFNLLLLNYSNASISLPQVIANPDWDFLTAVLVITGLLCAIGFGGGWILARGFKTDVSSQASLMFGLGMNNNGTGLVLASMALADHPQVMLPIIFYNLVQHLVAGVVDFTLFRKPTPDPLHAGASS
ncbi:MAG TPA: bile acid:sodium symporter [Pirellulales bacterium]|jgi:BASS family bile acid:Na+ symporter|nr:bile acid:sodium symporter [Pirellulales bacterium]